MTCKKRRSESPFNEKSTNMDLGAAQDKTRSQLMRMFDEMNKRFNEARAKTEKFLEKYSGMKKRI